MAQIIPSPASLPSTSNHYRRANVARLEPQHAEAKAALTAAGDRGVRWLVIPLSALLCAFLSIATVLASNIREMYLTPTLISVLAFVLIFAIVLVVNPFLRFSGAMLGQWARPLNRVELVCLFTALLVTSGVSTFGLTDCLVPLLTAPNNHEPKWNTPATGWDQTIVPSLNRNLYIYDSKVIDQFRRGVVLTDKDGHREFPPKATAPLHDKLAYGWRIYQAIPWRTWLRPLGYWLVFVAACYGIFYSLTYIVLSYWSDREKLIFPLARLSEAILPEAGGGRYRIPAILATPGFWIGFAISFSIWAWNACFDTNYGEFKGMGMYPLPLGMPGNSVNTALAHTVLGGLAMTQDSQLMFLVIFTAIGIAFLLPLEVSFSVWFYYVMGRVAILTLSWLGQAGAVVPPSDYLGQSNAITSLGGGGIFFFSALCLFRCIRDYVRMAAGKGLGRRIIIALPVLGLLASCAVVVAWLNWNRMPIAWGVVFVACLTLLTIGLMRIVAESGMYWFQANTGFFHIYKVLGLGRWLAPSLAAPLLPIYSVLFLDIKTFMPPNLLNAAEMGKNSHASRGKFHLNLLVCIALSVGVSLFTAIYLGHLRGGKQMESWFYVDNPPYLFNAAQRLITTKPQFDQTNAVWYGIGALWVALRVALRSVFFWFPHPIGFIMLINPLIGQLWFSFFLGWVCKRVVVRYGGKASYDRVRSIFIGLIAGELLAVFFWAGIGLLTGKDIRVVTLNRYA